MILRRKSVFGPSACPDVPYGLGAASTVYGKLHLQSDLMELDDLPSFKMTGIYPTNKLTLGTKRQKKAYDHF
jgi:hypothetical protein